MDLLATTAGSTNTLAFLIPAIIAFIIIWKLKCLIDGQNTNPKNKHIIFDPDFSFFRAAKRYSASSTDHDSKFRAFRDFLFGNSNGSNSLFPPGSSSPYVIQFVCHPNFEQHRKVISYYISNYEKGRFDLLETLPDEYHRANSYHNYKTIQNVGHPRGLYYELNLYTLDGVSKHHTSRVKGIHFPRDDSHDMKYGRTKGRHWKD